MSPALASTPAELSLEDYNELAMALGTRYWDVVDPVTVAADGTLHIADAVREDMDAHLRRRYEEFLTRYAPWIEKVRPLEGARVLEIGAGTGSWTVALCQRGAIVDGIDIDTRALGIAQKRCTLHGITSGEANFIHLNATDIDKLPSRYDIALFCASFEHMTHGERKTSLKKAWEQLRPGGLLGILECPNRLWYDDRHTTFRNFFNWLPDELAIDYARFYDRPGLAATFTEDQARDIAAVELARWGRGGSYHDIEVVLGPITGIDVKEGLDDHLRQMDRGYDDWWKTSHEASYRAFLRKLEPEVPGAFFYPWLHVILQKQS